MFITLAVMFASAYLIVDHVIKTRFDRSLSSAAFDPNQLSDELREALAKVQACTKRKIGNPQPEPCNMLHILQTEPPERTNVSVLNRLLNAATDLMPANFGTPDTKDNRSWTR